MNMTSPTTFIRGLCAAVVLTIAAGKAQARFFVVE
jgi:hypothetical protein